MPQYALVLAVFLATVPSAHAEWIQMAGNDRVDAYMDLALLQKKDNYVLSWRLFNYRSPQKNNLGRGFRSATTLVATRCSDRTEAMLSFIQYEGAMAKGSVVARRDIPGDEQQVSKIAPGTIGEALSKVACERYKMW